MKIHHVEQGSAEWWALRLGIPTASCFDRIMTPKGKPSAQATGYHYQLLAEYLMGEPGEQFESQWMGRGKHLEPEAVAYYEMIRDLTTDPGGFITSDDATLGCSPDRLVYETGQHDAPVGGLEIKCPSPAVHMRYLMEGGIGTAYEHQVQGCLWITGLDWWDTLSYHPAMPPALVRVEPDPEWVERFSPLMGAFLTDLQEGRGELQRMGYKPALEEAV